MVVASLAALLARFLPRTSEYPGIHWMKMEGKMELMGLWTERVRVFDEMSASHNDLLSVQKKMVVGGWFVLVDTHNNVDSMAAAASS